MPQSAIATGLVDLVLPLAKIPEQILRFARTQPRVVVPEDGTELNERELQLLHKIFTLVRTRTGRDFSRYKRSTVMRRLRRRMQLSQTEELDDYLQLLREESSEVTALSNDFLITVTNFFRDPSVFEQLEQTVIPQLLAGKSADQSVRVWSVGCSTGEEAYSLAMLLLEEAARQEVPPELQVFASDLHETSLLKAREGFYPGDIEEHVTPERLRRFFVKEDGGYRIRKEVRDLVVFAPHNLMGDPPFSRIDLIACRNVLIYLQREVQNDVIELFHYALQPEGYLLLGTSETVEGSELFRTENKQHCLFRKRNVPAPELRLPVFPLTNARPAGLAAPATEHERAPIVYGALHQQIVERFAPPSLLVGPNYKVVHLSEHVGRYLIHPGGEVTTNVFKLVRPELHAELRATLHAAREQNRPARSKTIALPVDGKSSKVILSVLPPHAAQEEGFFVVCFDEPPVFEPTVLFVDKPVEGNIPEAEPPLRELEHELDLTRQRLQSITEEYETSQEEMKASNEEMQSTNEELRSTMEELETSKEELQSTNEELTTLNQENRHKVEELSQLSGDLQNLLAATHIATLFLDRQLRIMRFTPQVTELFNVRLQDRGRPLSDITHRLGYDELRDDAERVLDKLVPAEREVSDEAGQWYLTRVLPYRSAADRIGGVVITFVDITARKRSEEALRKSEEHLRLILESAIDYAIFTTDPGGTITNWNTGAERIFGYRRQEAVGQPGNLIFVADERTTEPQRELDQIEEHGQATFKRWHLRQDGSTFWGSGALMPLHQSDQQIRGYLRIVVDNTDRRAMEQDLRQAKDEAERAAQAKEDFLAHMSHEIRTPLNAVVGITNLLLQQNPRDEQLENLRTLRFSADNLHVLVNDILDFSKLQAGKVLVEETPLKLKELLGSLEKAHCPQAEDRGVELRFQLDEQLPEVVRTDALKLSQILNNLLSNAVKFTRQGAVTVTVTVNRREKDRLWTTFAVQDTGIGIAPDKLVTIFDVFTQADISTVREYGGTGLGLSIVKLLLNLMDSGIEVESTVGKGSCFFFTLPMSVDTKEEPASIAPVAVADDLPAPLRVLLVEDEAVNRMVMIQYLQHWWQFSPAEAENGKRAVEMAQRQPYDLILMDVRMPVMDGYEAARRIRSLPGYANTPILALTADTADEVKKHVEAQYFTVVLTKPYDPQKLRQEILRHAYPAAATNPKPEAS